MPFTAGHPSARSSGTQLGAFVQWNPANNTILATRAGAEVQLTIGSRIAFVNGAQVALDVPAMIVGGRTLVPLRFVSEAMGAGVEWDTASRTAFVPSGAAAQPVPPRVISPPPAPRQALIVGDGPDRVGHVQRGTADASGNWRVSTAAQPYFSGYRG